MTTTPFTIIVNDQTLAVTPEQAIALDAIALSDNHFHVLKNDISYRASIETTDYPNKAYTIKVNGTSYTVKIADIYDCLIQQMGMNVGGASKTNSVLSPMPGLVLSILVKEGQVVEKGENLLVLEAMKMENVLKSTGAGVVKKINVIQGTVVEKRQLLIEME
jgi:biotin carboxyl carrier protein